MAVTKKTYKADQIYIAFKDGHVTQLFGGVYLPETFVRHAFKNDTEIANVTEIASKSKLSYAVTPMHGKSARLLANTVGVATSVVVTPVFAVVGLLASAVGGKEKEDADRIFWAVTGKGSDWGKPSARALARSLAVCSGLRRQSTGTSG